jgi:alkanesulfonate monooxygenase SsuD/methylene tetrahydromethanopterin reductase-like flavin-dependent oxidoreductase (luciferase family)
MSGGRIDVGLGAGWNETEHASYGLPFPDITERADMLEEQLEIIRNLLEGPDGWSFEGRHYQVRDAVVRPKAQRRIRIIVGGEGAPRSMRLAARHADEFNLSSQGPDAGRQKFAALDEACRAIGREPSSLNRSAMVGVLVGANQAEVDRRVRDLMAALGHEAGGSAATRWLEERRRRWIIGTPDEARAMVERFAAAGAERIMLQDFIARDLDMIDLLGEELVARG